MLTKAKFGEASGTHLVGAIDASYEKLVEVFGPPHHREDAGPYNEDTGEKVRCEWSFRTGRKLPEHERPTWYANRPIIEIVTIYDWKEFRPIENVRDWHIGGFSGSAVDFIHRALAGSLKVRKVFPRPVCPCCYRPIAKAKVQK